MTDSLAIYTQFDNLQRAAMALYKSGYFKDAESEAQAIVKVMAGAELGLPPFASMSGINIIKGKPALGSNVVATLVKNDPRYNYRIQVCDNTTCTLEWYENNKPVGVATFTMDEAKKAGLAGKDNWTKYPSDMLFARAITRGARRFAPGVFGGSPVYTPEEMGADTDEEGYIVDAVVREVVPQVVPDVDPAWTEPTNVQVMSLEFANSELSSDGTKYGDIPTEKLSHMINAISKSMKKPGVADENMENYWRKFQAIETIIASRIK